MMFCLLVVIMVIFSLSLVSAGFNYHEIKASNGTINLDDHTLKVPEGYVQDMDFEKVNQPYGSDDLYWSGVRFNQTGSSNYFSIFVTYSNDGRMMDSYNPGVNYTNVTINGVDGIQFVGGNETIFSYLEKGALVEIHSNSGSEIFEKIV